MSRSSGLALPDPMELLPYLALAGGAWLVFRPGPDGTSLFQKVGGAVGGVGGGANALGTGINKALTGSGPNNPGAANSGGGDSFNINTDPYVSRATANTGGPLGAVLNSAHIGLGHVGGGGTFSVRLWASSGGLFGIGGTQPIKLGEQFFSVQADQGWTGYGVDFPTTPIAGIGGGWFGPFTVSVWADIIDANGNLYTQAQLPVITTV